MKEKVLVTGGAGYVGSVLVPKLIRKNYEVRVLDLMMFGSHGLNSVKDDCEIIRGDIRDENCLERCLRGVDYVIHLASISNDPCSELDHKLTEEVNYGATKNLIDLAKKSDIKKFIFSSTSSVYGIKKEPNVTEDLSLEPLTIYSRTKAMAEEVIKKATDDNLATVSIRSATVCGYSPRMRLDLAVNILAEHAINKNKITVFGGEQKRPNIHIEDITDYYADLLEIYKGKIAGEIFNAGSENHTIMQIAEMVREVIGKDIQIEKKETKDIRSYHISSEKIKCTLGFEPKKTIKDAIIDLKKAFELGFIPNPSNSIYRNIEKMKEIKIK